MRLVDNWKHAWKWASVNCMAAAASVQGAWIYIPDDMRDKAPHHLVGIVTMVLLFLGIAGRLTQGGKKPVKKAKKKP